MKYFIVLAVKVLVVVFALYMFLGHLTHEYALNGYKEGCKDVILDVTERSGHDVDDQIITDYCNDLSNQYEKKK